MQVNYSPPNTSRQPGGSTLLDRCLSGIAAAFTRLENLTGLPNGLAPLGADGLVPAEFLADAVTPATLHVSVTAAANTAVTATLPAVSGKRHAIVALQLVRAATTAIVGSAILTTTSTNLPGGPAWTAGNLIAAGQSIIDLDYQPANPLLALASATATTIVMPAAGATVVNRINVSYLLVDA